MRPANRPCCGWGDFRIGRLLIVGAFLTSAACTTNVASTTNIPPLKIIRFAAGTPQHPYPLHLSITNLPTAIAALNGARIETNQNNVVLHIPLFPEEALWGFGERFDSLNQRGHIVESRLVDAWGGGNRSYFAVPFFISSTGYGLFVNSTGKVVFDCGVTKPDELRIEIPGTGADIYFFPGRPREILSSYTSLVGRPQAVPDWVFTPWISRNSYVSAADVDQVIDRMEQYHLKAGAVVLEAWAEGLQNFKFEPHRYPHPAEWIAKLHARGYHVLCWETPSLWDSASTYPEAHQNGYLVLNPDGTELRLDWLENAVKMDFRKLAARTWWTQLHEPLVAMGIDGFKTDGGERQPDEWFHNLHPFYYQRAVLDAFTNQTRQGVTFARSASPPCAGNAAFWGGDQSSSWQDLPSVVRGGLSAALGGFAFWGHDIGGYSGTPDKKLYLRWLELGTFSPIMQWHGTTPREPWYYDAETIRIARYYLDLRWALQPYLTALAKDATASGVPLWRPLLWDSPHDPAVQNLADEFMLGDDLLVAPVLDELGERSIYLPAGSWEDLWTKETFTGPKRIQRTVPLDGIPVFRRAGSKILAGVQPFRNPQPAVEMILAGDTNERGVVPRQRLINNVSPVNILVVIKVHNHSAVTGEVSILSPAPLTIPSGPKQSYVAAPDKEAHLSFYVNCPTNLPVGSYPVTLSSPASSEVMTLVKLPPWKENPRNDGWIDLDKSTDAETTFDSPASESAKLWIGSGKSLTVWLNDSVVYDKQTYRTPEPDEDKVNVSLVAGRNTLRIKLSNPPGTIGSNGFYLRVEADPAGYSTAPPLP